MKNDPHPKLELQISSSKALVRRIDQRIDLVERLLAEAEKAQALVLPSSFTNSLGMKMIWCPPGEFLMGSPLSERSEYLRYENQAQVTLSQGYWMATTPVTQGQWQRVMHQNPSHFRTSDDLPVENVRWNDAQDFIATLNEAVAAPEETKFALPTEAQWEYACRAGTTGPYSSNLDAMAWYEANSSGTTHPVATKAANAWGLYDMHGNVWEWTADCGGSHLEGGIDPIAQTTDYRHVLRGGSWKSRAVECRSAQRYFECNPGSIIGFRVAAVRLKMK